MDHFEGVVLDYLRADRALFVNSQCCIQLNEGANPDTSGPHWYCDAVAVSFKEQAAYLCEITYAARAPSLLARLRAWDEHWPGVRAARLGTAVCRWIGVQARLFVPESNAKGIQSAIGGLKNLPSPRVTFLEEVLPGATAPGSRCIRGRVPMTDLNITATSYALLQGKFTCWKCSESIVVTAIWVPGFLDNEDEEYPEEGGPSLLKYVSELDVGTMARVRAAAPAQAQLLADGQPDLRGQPLSNLRHAAGDHFIFSPDGPFFPKTRPAWTSSRSSRGTGP